MPSIVELKTFLKYANSSSDSGSECHAFIVNFVIIEINKTIKQKENNRNSNSNEI